MGAGGGGQLRFPHQRWGPVQGLSRWSLEVCASMGMCACAAHVRAHMRACTRASLLRPVTPGLIPHPFPESPSPPHLRLSSKWGRDHTESRFIRFLFL